MHWNTVGPLLREVIEILMCEPVFNPFRLVGGTGLSLQKGHRSSIDIDLFTDAEYGSIDFIQIDKSLKEKLGYVVTNQKGPVGMGLTYFAAHSEKEAVKIDLYYTEPFIRDLVEEEGIRMASIEDIIGMKIDIMGRSGRKKDFWDIHAIENEFSLVKMLSLYKEKYPYGFSEMEIRKGLVNFEQADHEPDPICLLGKHWELIKLDFTKWVNLFQAQGGNA